jgi:hypothetical protein
MTVSHERSWYGRCRRRVLTSDDPAWARHSFHFGTFPFPPVVMITLQYFSSFSASATVVKLTLSLYLNSFLASWKQCNAHFLFLFCVIPSLFLCCFCVNRAIVPSFVPWSWLTRSPLFYPFPLLSSNWPVQSSSASESHFQSRPTNPPPPCRRFAPSLAE